MNWQDEYPKKEGWYWKKSKWDDEPEVVKVRKCGGKMCIGNWELPAKTVWCGPIQEPGVEMEFTEWWHNVGSGIRPAISSDMESHAQFVANAAWNDAQQNTKAAIQRAIDDNVECVDTPNGKYVNRQQVMDCINVLSGASHGRVEREEE